MIDAKPGPAMSARGGTVQQALLSTGRRDLLRLSVGAVAVFAAPRIGHSASDEAKRTSGEIRHRTVETNGIQMHLAEQGEGALDVLRRGLPASSDPWRY